MIIDLKTKRIHLYLYWELWIIMFEYIDDRVDSVYM